MLDAYLYEGKRTPFGRHAGALAKVRPDDLLGGVIKQVVAQSKFKPEQIEDVIVGCANQGGEDRAGDLNEPRPDEVPDAFRVGHDAGDQDTGLRLIEVADGQAHHVGFHVLAHVGDGALGLDALLFDHLCRRCRILRRFARKLREAAPDRG